ncbi:hypothetical protein K502DRAFT_323997 [Neoconidiobolus thromboides FSU 785]|nr:hypothetical protein K502DRAFT_323997 [Neoconidiobolus thromboides FSU 785]
MNKSGVILPSLKDVFGDFLLPGPKIVLVDNSANSCSSTDNTIISANDTFSPPRYYYAGINNNYNQNGAADNKMRNVSYRIRKSKEQEDILYQVFQRTPFPDKVLRKRLSEKLSLPVRKIQIWFQNQRQKVKLLRNFQSLPL